MASRLELHRLVVLGDGGVGKTALVIQVTMNHFIDTYDPTIEECFRKQVMVDGQAVIAEILDTAGQEEYSALRELWIKDSEAAVLVYSIASRNSFNRINKFHEQILHVKGSKIPVILVGNKSDRATEREVSMAEGFALARELGCTFVEASAKECLNVQKAFYDLIRESRRQRALPQVSQITTGEVSPLPVGSPHNRTPSNSKLSLFTPLLRLFREIKVDIREEHKHDVVHQLALDRVLIQAARRADLKGIKKCLGNGADPNAQPGPDGSALHASAALGHSKVVQLLLENGAAYNAKGPREVTALQLASADGHYNVVKILLKAGADVNTLSSSHGTALIAATFRGHLDIARCLLKHRANVNIKAGQYGNALQTAAVTGKLAIARLLLDAGASVRARGDGDCTALQAACNAGHAHIVRLLVDRGADINAKGGRFGIAIQAAIDASRFDVFNVLIKYGADVSTLKPTQLTKDRILEADAQNKFNSADSSSMQASLTTGSIVLQHDEPASSALQKVESDVSQTSGPTEGQANALHPSVPTPILGSGNHGYAVINIFGNARAILGNVTPTT